jgi:hypothetical protein
MRIAAVVTRTRYPCSTALRPRPTASGGLPTPRRPEDHEIFAVLPRSGSAASDRGLGREVDPGCPLGEYSARLVRIVSGRAPRRFGRHVASCRHRRTVLRSRSNRRAISAIGAVDQPQPVSRPTVPSDHRHLLPWSLALSMTTVIGRYVRRWSTAARGLASRAKGWPVARVAGRSPSPRASSPAEENRHAKTEAAPAP